MPQPADYNITEKDLTYAVGDFPDSIVGIQGVTIRGKISDAEKVYASWSAFQADFGGFTGLDPDAVHQIKRAMDRGVRVRISRVAHYTNPQDESTLTATFATAYAGQIVTVGSTLLNGAAAVTVKVNGLGAVTIPWAGTHTAMMQAIVRHLNTNYPGVIATAFVATTGPTVNPYDIIVVGTTDTSLTGLDVTVGATVYSATDLTTTLENAGGNTLLTVTPIAQGSDYNNVIVKVDRASNGQDGYFNATVYHLTDGNANEEYTNLSLKAVASLNEQTGLQPLRDNGLVNITTPNLTGYAGSALTPTPVLISFEGGTNGGALTQADYIGGDDGVGLKAFDDYDDLIAIASVDRSSADVALAAAGAAYVEMRKDCVYLISMINSNDANALAASRDATNIDSSYVGFYGGHLTVLHPVTGAEVVIPSIGDVLGLAGKNIDQNGPQSSWAGVNRGIVSQVMKVVNDMGKPARKGDLKLVSNHQINMVIKNHGKIFLKGNFTAQRAFSVLSYMNVRIMLIFIRKGLAEILERYLEEPNLPRTWKLLYMEVEPFLERWKSDDGLYDYDWQGDQNATSLKDLVINNANDVGLGKYKVKLFLKAVPTIQDIQVDIVLTPAGISFEEILGTLNP